MSPTNGMALIVAVHATYSTIMAYLGEQTSDQVELMYSLGFSLNVVWCVYMDRCRRGETAPIDFEFFVFFGWPLVLPYYLVRTRGYRAVPICVAIGFAFLLPYLAALSVYQWVWS